MPLVWLVQVLPLLVVPRIVPVNPTVSQILVLAQLYHIRISPSETFFGLRHYLA